MLTRSYAMLSQTARKAPLPHVMNYLAKSNSVYVTPRWLCSLNRAPRNQCLTSAILLPMWTPLHAYPMLWVLQHSNSESVGLLSLNIKQLSIQCNLTPWMSKLQGPLASASFPAALSSVNSIPLPVPTSGGNNWEGFARVCWASIAVMLALLSPLPPLHGWIMRYSGTPLSHSQEVWPPNGLIMRCNYSGITAH